MDQMPQRAPIVYIPQAGEREFFCLQHTVCCSAGVAYEKSRGPVAGQFLLSPWSFFLGAPLALEGSTKNINGGFRLGRSTASSTPVRGR